MRRFLWGVVAAVSTVSMVILAGCGTPTTVGGIQTSTPSPSATATATVSEATAAACFGSEYAAHNTLTQVGDFLMTPVNLSGHAYGSVALPAGTSLTKPYQLLSANDSPSGLTTNPVLDEGEGGFVLGLCNTSASQTYTITTFTATIATFAPYSGQLSEWNPCQGSMTSHRQLTPAGCGGGGVNLTRFHAVFQGSPVLGATVEMHQTGFDLKEPGDGAGRLPLAVVPRQVVYFGVGVDKPTQAGNYAFTFGMRLQSGKMLTTAASPTILLAPATHEWNGRACNQSAFLNQITLTDPETYYVCPVS